MTKTRAIPSIRAVHNPSALPRSNSRNGIKSPSQLHRPSRTQRPGACRQLLLHTWPWSPCTLLTHFLSNEVSPGMRSANGCKQVVWALTTSNDHTFSSLPLLHKSNSVSSGMGLHASLGPNQEFLQLLDLPPHLKNLGMAELSPVLLAMFR